MGAGCSRLEQDILEIHDALADPDERSAINAEWIIERIGQLQEAIAERDAARAELDEAYAALGAAMPLLTAEQIAEWRRIVTAHRAEHQALTEGQET